MATAFLHFVINESGNLWRKQPKWIDPTGCPTLKCIFWDGFCDNTIRLTDLQWWFLYSWGKIFWYSCLTFAKKIDKMAKFFIWKKNSNFFRVKNFFEIFQKKFFRYKSTQKGILSKNFFQKISKKFFWYKIFSSFKRKNLPFH